MNLKILKSLLQQASDYHPVASDIPLFVQGVVIAVLFGRLFYDSWIATLLLLPIVFPWVLVRKDYQRKAQIRQIGLQFRDAIYSVLTDLKAGYSVENAFIDARRDMELLYGKKSDIVGCLQKINKGLTNNIPLEKLLFSMGKESENQDIQEFASVFAVAKRSGGNMTEIIERSIDVISRKLDVEKEIDVLISAKRLEARIMEGVPFFILLYISITSPGFFDALYHNLFGIIVMTICMVIYICSYLLSEKIVNISV